MFDGRFRSRVDKGVSPIGTALGRTGLSPDHLTALGLLMAVPAAAAIGTGRLGLGLILLIVSAVPDLLDGALAKANGTASKRGAFFDSVADRVTDGLILGGIAWYLQSTRHGHAAMLPFAVLAVSILISYERAKAESLGFTAKGGLMERAERIILLCIGLVASVILVPILWAMLILTAATAVQRFAKVWRQATLAIVVESDRPVSAPPHAPGPAAGDGDSNAAMTERWRTWRQQAPARRSGTATAPRPSRVGHQIDGARRATRWEDRRAARHQAQDDGKGGAAPVGRRHGTRRP
ncbi:MAG: CDP-diacylglycerol---glycerol-3-phosphate 3-phosphatidyltransferase [Acidimicrobiaceae bacterium]|nr:CDP-diacylglycerol---glycerol-3-phosphate 3-phosphatidyltransferase [Acidimicrobiaceae bacterium]